MIGLSVGSDKDLIEINASDILAKIQKGEPVNCTGAKIKGNLDLNSLRIYKHSDISINSSIIIYKSVVDGNIDFSFARFNSKTSFGYSNFNGSIDFSNSHFNHEDSPTFYKSSIGGSAHFVGTIFDNTSSFKETQFGDYTTFYNASFRGGTSFENSQFNNVADFESSVFFAADFKNSRFKDNANFLGSKFIGDGNFNESQFESVADFEGTIFNSNAYFDGSIFKTQANFVGSHFSKGAWLQHIQFGTIFIRWMEVVNSISKERNLSKYTNFINNYKKIYWFEDADDCYYHYRKNLRQIAPMGAFSFAIDFAAEKTYGYGVKPIILLDGLY